MDLTRRQFLDLAAATAALRLYPVSQWRKATRRSQYASSSALRLRRNGHLGAFDEPTVDRAAWSAFLVENRTGAGTNIATEAVVRAPADGYTLLMATNANSINATLYENLNFNFIRDLAPVAMIADVPFIMLVNPLFPAQSVSD